MGGAKPNVQNAGRQIQFFCAVGCFNFFLCRLVCRQVGLLVGVEIQRNCLPSLGRLKSLVRMSKVDGLVVLLLVVVSSNRLAYNS